MPEMADRFPPVAAAFTDRVRNVPADRWDAPAPCEGWVARDVVRHLVGWLPAFFDSRGVELPRVDAQTKLLAFTGRNPGVAPGT